MTILVWRYPEGVILNSPEYLLDEQDQVLEFESEQQARGYLAKYGIADPEESGIHFQREVDEAEEQHPPLPGE